MGSLVVAASNVGVFNSDTALREAGGRQSNVGVNMALGFGLLICWNVSTLLCLPRMQQTRTEPKRDQFQALVPLTQLHVICSCLEIGQNSDTLDAPRLRFFFSIIE